MLRVWLSMCSRHQARQPGCRQCAQGVYAWRWALWLSQISFRLAPRLWRRWVHREPSAARRRLNKRFRQLRKR